MKVTAVLPLLLMVCLLRRVLLQTLVQPLSQRPLRSPLPLHCRAHTRMLLALPQTLQLLLALMLSRRQWWP